MPSRDIGDREKEFVIQAMMNWGKLLRECADIVIGAIENNQSEIVKEAMIMLGFTSGAMPAMAAHADPDGPVEDLVSVCAAIYSLQNAYLFAVSPDYHATPESGPISEAIIRFWTSAKELVAENDEMFDDIEDALIEELRRNRGRY